MPYAYAQRHKPLVLLAALLADDLAKGGKGQIDLDAAQRQCSSAGAADQINYNYFLAKYLSLHGKADEAVRYWTRCMTCLGEAMNMRLFSRTLAGAELLQRGTTPADYKAALQQPQPGAKQK